MRRERYRRAIPEEDREGQQKPIECIDVGILVTEPLLDWAIQRDRGPKIRNRFLRNLQWQPPWPDQGSGKISIDIEPAVMLCLRCDYSPLADACKGYEREVIVISFNNYIGTFPEGEKVSNILSGIMPYRTFLSKLESALPLMLDRVEFASGNVEGEWTALITD